MNTKTIVILQAALGLMLTACNNGQTSAGQARQGDTLSATSIKQESVPLTQSVTYKKEVTENESKFSCKGAVLSVNDVEVSSRISEQIVMLGVDMGQRVRKGQVLVRLDKTATEDKIMKARAELEQADYRYQAILMGQGYKRDALSQAPEDLRQQARVSSGYNTARAELRQLEHQLSYCTIVAPVSGVVSQREANNYTLAVPGKTLFRIIDTEHLKVCFDVLENELHRIGVSTPINVIPISYPDERYTTRIAAVSPIVEKSGMVRMEAPLPSHPHLMPGMTVVVTLGGQ